MGLRSEPDWSEVVEPEVGRTTELEYLVGAYEGKMGLLQQTIARNGVRLSVGLLRKNRIMERALELLG